jgi:CDP-diacylglycerol--glycerol-3-phosphate 3-phosphatidyltransferase
MVIGFLPSWVTPNFLSIARLALIPLVIWCLWYQYFLPAFLLAMLAIMTDSLDGTLARIRNQQSRLGQIVDPLADKLLMTAILGVCYLLYIQSTWLLLIILADVIMMIVSTVILTGGGDVLPANYWGKAKMVAQSLLVLGFFVYLFFESLLIITLLDYLIPFTFLVTFGAVISYSSTWLKHLDKNKK